MVSNEVVMQTVKRMLLSGIDDATIKATLTGINLTESEINSILVQAKSGSAAASVVQNEEAPGQGDEEYAGDDETDENSGDENPEGEAPEGEDIGGKIESASEEQAAAHITTHNILDEHSGKMEQMHRDISALHEKLDSAPNLSNEQIANLSVLSARISALEREVGETKASTIAIQGLLQKILETDRKTLLELQKK